MIYLAIYVVAVIVLAAIYKTVEEWVMSNVMITCHCQCGNEFLSFVPATLCPDCTAWYEHVFQARIEPDRRLMIDWNTGAVVCCDDYTELGAPVAERPGDGMGED